ncbi:MAG TPA: hypothetical protein VK994_04370 [Bacteroidales bacterium]|nr:hypothetical protein [Bacteroidales bacterium]
MKRISILMLLVALIAYGCEKQELQPTGNDKKSEKVVSKGYLLNISDDITSLEMKDLVLQEFEINPEFSTLKNGNSAHTHGSWLSNNGSTYFSWSGTENNGGPHGSAYVEFGANNPATSIKVNLETECVMVIENEAVYGGTVVSSENAPPFLPFFNPGWHMYFKVIDNGQGNNAPPDQFGSLIVFSAPEQSNCGVLTPDNPFWSILPAIDILPPGSVKVNN